MDKIIAQGLVSEGPFNDFLTKGLYDPRIFLRIYAFILDENYFAVCRQYPEYGYDPTQYDTYQKHLAEIKKLPDRVSIYNAGIEMSKIPDSYITEELLLVAFTKGYSWFNVKKIHGTLRIYLKFLEIIRKPFGTYLTSEYYTKDFECYELCLRAVKQNGLALQFINDKFKEEHLCFVAVYQNGLALQFVSDECKTYDICYIACKENGLALQFISDKIKKSNPRELFKRAVEQNYRVIEFVPPEYRTIELYLIVVAKNGLYLEHVPEENKLENMSKLAVRQNYRAIEFVPLQHRTEELYQLVVQQNGLYLEHIPEKNKSFIVCLEAVKQNGLALQFVSEEFKRFNL